MPPRTCDRTPSPVGARRHPGDQRRASKACSSSCASTRTCSRCGSCETTDLNLETDRREGEDETRDEKQRWRRRRGEGQGTTRASTARVRREYGRRRRRVRSEAERKIDGDGDGDARAGWSSMMDAVLAAGSIRSIRFISRGGRRRVTSRWRSIPRSRIRRVSTQPRT